MQMCDGSYSTRVNFHVVGLSQRDDDSSARTCHYRRRVTLIVLTVVASCRRAVVIVSGIRYPRWRAENAAYVPGLRRSR